MTLTNVVEECSDDQRGTAHTHLMNESKKQVRRPIHKCKLCALLERIDFLSSQLLQLQ